MVFFFKIMILKAGDQNTNVAYWQVFLIKQGYNLTPDTHFGPKTERATRSFQITAHLRPDGIVGSGTIAAAKSRGFGGFPNESTSSPNPSENPNSSEKLILISAGHTNTPGQDRGAAGNGFIEGILAVELRDAVAAELRRIAPGISVLEDGVDGVNEPLKKALVLARKSDIAVEFHWNAGPTSATGIEVLSKPNKKLLAQGLAKSIADATGLVLRGDKGWKSDTSGAHHRLAFCEAGGVILEVCFMSNPSDMRVYEQNFENIVINLVDTLAAA